MNFKIHEPRIGVQSLLETPDNKLAGYTQSMTSLVEDFDDGPKGKVVSGFQDFVLYNTISNAGDSVQRDGAGEALKCLSAFWGQ